MIHRLSNGQVITVLSIVAITQFIVFVRSIVNVEKDCA